MHCTKCIRIRSTKLCVFVVIGCVPITMPTIKESDMVGEEPSEESSLQISTSPEQIVSSVPSRALHVRKSNTKQSAESSSRSSSARSSSRPPTGAPSH